MINPNISTAVWLHKIEQRTRVGDRVWVLTEEDLESIKTSLTFIPHYRKQGITQADLILLTQMLSSSDYYVAPTRETYEHLTNSSYSQRGATDKNVVFSINEVLSTILKNKVITNAEGCWPIYNNILKTLKNSFPNKINNWIFSEFELLARFIDGVSYTNNFSLIMRTVEYFNSLIFNEKQQMRFVIISDNLLSTAELLLIQEQEVHKFYKFHNEKLRDINPEFYTHYLINEAKRVGVNSALPIDWLGEILNPPFGTEHNQTIDSDIKAI